MRDEDEKKREIPNTGGKSVMITIYPNLYILIYSNFLVKMSVVTGLAACAASSFAFGSMYVVSWDESNNFV
jgi:hypothetical protein